jgi:hypothetical protein
LIFGITAFVKGARMIVSEPSRMRKPGRTEDGRQAAISIPEGRFSMRFDLSRFDPFFKIQQNEFLPEMCEGLCFAISLDWIRRKLKKKNPRASFMEGKDDQVHDLEWLKKKATKDWAPVQSLHEKVWHNDPRKTVAVLKTLRWVSSQNDMLTKFTPQEQRTIKSLVSEIPIWEAKNYKTITSKEVDAVSDLWQRGEQLFPNEFPKQVRHFEAERLPTPVIDSMVEIAEKWTEKWDVFELECVKSAPFEWTTPPGIFGQVAKQLPESIGQSKDGDFMLIIFSGVERKKNLVITARHAMAVQYRKQPCLIHFLDPNHHEFLFKDPVSFADYIDALWHDKKIYGNCTWENWAVFRAIPVG